MAETDDFDLSITAQTVAGAWFGMSGTTGYLHFGMVESRPTGEAQAGLDELVAKGWISRENERHGGVMYRPLKDMRPIAAPLMLRLFSGDPAPERTGFKLIEKIDGTPAIGKVGTVEFERLPATKGARK